MEFPTHSRDKWLSKQIELTPETAFMCICHFVFQKHVFSFSFLLAAFAFDVKQDKFHGDYVLKHFHVAEFVKTVRIETANSRFELYT